MRSSCFLFQFPVPSVFLKYFRRKKVAFASIFGNALSGKRDCVVVFFFPFAFHIALQKPFTPFWSGLRAFVCCEMVIPTYLLLYDHEPSRALFAPRFMSVLTSLLPASEEFVLEFLYLSVSGSYPFDLSGLRGLTGSNANVSSALRLLILAISSTAVRWSPHYRGAQDG